MKARIEYCTAQNGQITAQIGVHDNPMVWLHSAQNPGAEANWWDAFDLWGEIIILQGVGCGWHLTKLLPQLSNVSLLVVVDYFESNCQKWLASLSLDFIPKNILSLSSQSSTQSILQVQKAIDTQPSFGVQMITHSASVHLLKNWYAQVTNTIIPKQKSGYGGAATKPQTVTQANWMLLHGNHFLQNELQHALQHNQVNHSIFEYTKYQYGRDLYTAFQKNIHANHTTCIVSINAKGLERSTDMVAYAAQMGVPVVVWFVDDPRPILLSHEYTNLNHVYAFCWEKSYIPWLQQKGFAQCTYLPLAADPYAAYPCTPQTQCKLEQPSFYKQSICFAGSTMGDAFLQSIRNKMLWTPQVEQIATALCNGILQNPDLAASTPQNLIHTLSLKLPFQDERNLCWLQSLAIHKASHQQRISALRSIDCAQLTVVGDEDWGDYLKKSVLLPALSYGSALFSMYANSQVNLNSTSRQMPTALNQRMFDIPLSNGFVLTDYQQDLDELFDKTEYASYASLEEMKEKMEYYLQAPEARHKIIAAAKHSILNNHTYWHRLQSIFLSLYPRS